MIQKRVFRYTGLYKKYIKLKINYLNHKKLYKFNRLKWQNFLKYLRKKNIYKFDHSGNYKPKFSFYYKTKFRNNLYKKQRIKFYYGSMRRKRLKEFCKSSLANYSNKGNLSEKGFSHISTYLIDCVESQLYMIIFRSLFSQSVRQAKQLIFQGNVLVNGCIVLISTYSIKKGDIVSFKTSSYTKLEKHLIANFKNRSDTNPPSFLKINYSTFQILIINQIKNTKHNNLYPFSLDINYLSKYKQI